MRKDETQTEDGYFRDSLQSNMLLLTRIKNKIFTNIRSRNLLLKLLIFLERPMGKLIQFRTMTRHVFPQRSGVSALRESGD